MNNATQTSVQLREAIDQVEEAYEFMLAYAAQGRSHETETEGASQIREFLERFRSAADILLEATPQLFSPDNAFAKRFSDDTHVMLAVLNLLLDKKSISSDMIDNTNGLISVRSFLTDLFFVDQVVLPPRSTT